MTPKAKAKELFNKYLSINLSQVNDLVDGIRIALAKKCALIAVDEIMQVLSILPYGMQYLSEIDYWEEVKKNLEKL